MSYNSIRKLQVLIKLTKVELDAQEHRAIFNLPYLYADLNLIFLNLSLILYFIRISLLVIWVLYELAGLVAVAVGDVVAADDVIELSQLCLQIPVG